MVQRQTLSGKLREHPLRPGRTERGQHCLEESGSDEEAATHGAMPWAHGAEAPQGAKRTAHARHCHFGQGGAHVELHNVRPLALAGLELGGAQDLDAGGLGPAEARHVLVCRARGGAGWGDDPAAQTRMPLHCCHCRSSVAATP